MYLFILLIYLYSNTKELLRIYKFISKCLSLFKRITIFIVAVVLFTSIFWIPASCVISYFDRKKLRHELKQIDWNQKTDLIHPSDRRRVIHIRWNASAYLPTVYILILCIMSSFAECHVRRCLWHVCKTSKIELYIALVNAQPCNSFFRRVLLNIIRKYSFTFL